MQFKSLGGLSYFKERDIYEIILSINNYEEIRDYKLKF